MTSSLTLDRRCPGDDPAADIRDLASRLCGKPVAAATRLDGSGNNRLYRIDTAEARYALKCYGAVDARGDRLEREFDGFSLVGKHGIDAVPAALAVDRKHRCALYEWVDGTRADPPSEHDIDRALDFVGALQRIARNDAQAWQGNAAEACLSATMLLEQIRGRLARLQSLEDEPALCTFITRDLVPAMQREALRLETLYSEAGLDPAVVIPPAVRVLSPSDFGFHNALRRPDGRLVFVDFEYFGWDDPAKLTADFLWHPGMHPDAAALTRWEAGMTQIFGDDAGFNVRLTAQRPLYAIRWCLIILNEFLPERWQRRIFAGNTDPTDHPRIKTEQLAKAQALFDRAVGPLSLTPMP